MMMFFSIETINLAIDIGQREWRYLGMSLNYKGILHIQGLDGQVYKSQAQAKTAKKSLRKELKKSEKKKKRLDAED